MFKWAAVVGFSIIYVGAIAASAFSQPVYAEGELPAIPYRRPVPLNEPIGANSEIVPLPNYAYPGTTGFDGVSVQTEEEKRAKAAEEAKVWAQLEERYRAEEAATAAEKFALTEKISADSLEITAKGWEQKSAIAEANLGVAKGVTASAFNEAKSFASSLTAKTELAERAKLAGMNVAHLSAQLNEMYYDYVGGDVKAKAQAARIVAADAWVRYARAYAKAVVARAAADKYREDFNQSAADSRIALADGEVKKAVTAYTAAVKNGSDLKTRISEASARYYSIKADLDAATALNAQIIEAVKKHTAAVNEVVTADQRGTAANNTAADIAKEIQRLQLGNATAADLAAGRAKVAAARDAAGIEHRASIAIRQKEVEMRVNAEALIAPLTANLQAGIQQELEAHAARVAERIKVSIEYADYNSELTKTAAARSKKIAETAAAEATARGKLRDAEAAVSEAEKTERTAQAAVDALKSGVSTGKDVAIAASALAYAKSQVANAKAALAAVKLLISQTTLVAAIAVTETEAKVLQIYPVQPNLDIAQLQRNNGAETTAEATARAYAEGVARLNKIAAERSALIEEKTRLFAESIARYSQLTLDATAVHDAHSALSIEVKERIQKSTDPVTLAQIRLDIALSLEKVAKTKNDLVLDAVKKAEAQVALATAIQQTEDEVAQLTGVRAESDSNGARQALEQANAAIQTARERYDESIRVRELANTAFEETVKKKATLNAANERFAGTAAKLEEMKAETIDETADVQEVVDSGANPKKVAEAVVELDKDRAREAAALADHADSVVKVSRATLRLRQHMMATVQEVIALFPYSAFDTAQAEDPSEESLQALVDQYKELANLVPIAEERVLRSRLAVEDIAEKLTISEETAEEASSAAAAAKKAADTLAEEQKERDGILANTTAKLAEIAARILPSVFSDSRISTYQETMKKREPVIAMNELEAAKARSELADAEVEVARADLKLSYAALDAAKKQLAAADAAYAVQWSKRAGLVSSELGEAALAADVAQESLTAARTQLRKSFAILKQVVTAAVAAKQTQVEGYARATEASPKKAAAAKDALDELVTYAAKVETDEAEAIEEERKQRWKQADALADHAEALMNGKVNRKIMIDKLVTQKMKEFDQHDCKNKKETDPLKCMVCNAQWEAGIDDSFVGKLLPNRVAMTRVYLEGRPYGDSVCEVIYDPNQFSWTDFPNKKTNGYYLLQNNDGMREEFTAALVAYYEVNLAYSYEMYYSPASMKPKNSEPNWWHKCKEQATFGDSIACRIRPAVDLTEIHSDASLRVFKDNVDYSSIAEYLD